MGVINAFFAPHKTIIDRVILQMIFHDIPKNKNVVFVANYHQE